MSKKQPLPKCVNCGAERPRRVRPDGKPAGFKGARGMCELCYKYWNSSGRQRMRPLDRAEMYASLRKPHPQIPMCDCGQPAVHKVHTSIYSKVPARKFMEITLELCEDCYQLEMEMRAEFGD